MSEKTELEKRKKRVGVRKKSGKIEVALYIVPVIIVWDCRFRAEIADARTKKCTF